MNLTINTDVFNEFPVLESERLLLREFEICDATDLYGIRSDEKVMNYMDSKKCESIKESENLIKSVFKSFKEQTGIHWAIIEKSSKKFTGYFSYWRIMTEHCRAEIGFALKPQFWSNGYMQEAANALIQFGFNELKLHSIKANVNPKNLNSIKLLEKLNFKKEAYFRENYLFEGKYIDSIIYSLLESDSS